MNRKKNAEQPRPRTAFTASVEPKPSAETARLMRRFILAGVLFALSLVAAAYVWADWSYGLPAGAEAKFVGRQSCVQCHQSQHSAWEGSHHDLAMDVATEK